MTKKEKISLKEVKFDAQSKQLVYVRSERATIVTPYHGTRISGVETFERHSDDEKHDDNLEQKLRAEVVAKGQALRADAYEIAVKHHTEGINYFATDEEDNKTYSILFAAIFYRKD